MSRATAFTSQVIFVTDFSQVTLAINSNETVGKVLSRYSDGIERQYSLEPGAMKRAILRAIPYVPFFWGRNDNSSSDVPVPQPTPENMLTSDIFAKAGGVYYLEVDSEVSKALLAKIHPSKKKNKKKKKKNLIEGEENENITPDVDEGDEVETVAVSEAESSSQWANIERKLADMQALIESEREAAAEERKNAVEERKNAVEERKKVNMLEKAMAEERKKTDGLEKAIVEERKNAVEERKKVNTLEKAMAEERKKTYRLEQTVKEGQKQVQNLESELEAVKEAADDATEWIATGCLSDSDVLRRIRLRTLLDRSQAFLAFLIGISDQPYTRTGSAKWRAQLVGSTPAERLQSIQDRLQRASPINPALSKLMQSTEAMTVVVEGGSKIREDGDMAAHHKLSKPQVVAAVEEYDKMGGDYVGGLKALIDFLFP